jgi:membrane associated rhomboid family serine protease
MERTGIVSLALIFVNLVVSYRGFKDYGFFQRYSFDISRIRIHKEYYRFISSGFLHSGWMHFLFNMIALYSFGTILEGSIGVIKFLSIYLCSLICGNLLSLYIHRHKSNYIAIGASGAVSGIVFAGIGLFPAMNIGMMLLPVSAPGWLFGLLYVLYCMFGIRGQRDNIGHDAHLGGGISGLILALALYPEAIGTNYLPVLVILLPSLVFLYLVFTRPGFLLLEKPFSKEEAFTIEDRYNASKRMKERELDRLLDKISTNGIQSLTKKEKERLEELSKVK